MPRIQHIYTGYLALASIYWGLAVALAQGDARLLFFTASGLAAIYLTIKRPWYYWTRAATAAALLGNTVLFSYQSYVYSRFVALGLYVAGGVPFAISLGALIAGLALLIHILLGTYRAR